MSAAYCPDKVTVSVAYSAVLMLSVRCILDQSSCVLLYVGFSRAVSYICTFGQTRSWQHQHMQVSVGVHPNAARSRCSNLSFSIFEKNVLVLKPDLAGLSTFSFTTSLDPNSSTWLRRSRGKSAKTICDSKIQRPPNM